VFYSRIFPIALFVISTAGWSYSDAQASSDSSEVIAGTVELRSAGEEIGFGGQRAPHFDAQRTKSMADDALSRKEYDAAFGHYWAVCDAGDADSCFAAAGVSRMLLREPVPSKLVADLYLRACKGGIDEACGAPAR